MKQRFRIGVFVLSVLAGCFFYSSTALAIGNQIVKKGSTVTVNHSWSGAYNYSWYGDDESLVQVEGNGNSCRLTGKSTGSTTIHCQYYFKTTYYRPDLKKWVTDEHEQRESFSVTVTNGEGQEGEAGVVVNPADCSEVGDLSCGLIPVKKNNRWGFVDRSWRLMIPFQYDEVTYLFNERTQTALVKYNGSYYAIDRMGNRYGPLANDLNYNYVVCNDFVELNYYGGGGIKWRKGDGTIIDRSNITDVKDLGDAFEEENVLIPGRKGDFYGYLNRDYQWVIEPQFDMAYSFHEERAIVLKNGRWHFIGRDGGIVTTLPEQMNFDRGIIQYTFNNGRSIVYFDWDGFYLADGLCPATDYEEYRDVPEFFYIDEKGNKRLEEYIWGTSFVDGMAIVVNEEGYEGVINTKNEVMIPFEYKYQYKEQKLPGGGMTYLGEGVFAFQETYGGTYILLTSNGKRLTGERYDSIQPFANGMAQVSCGGRYGYISPQGEMLIPLTYSRLRFWGDDRYALAQTADGGYEILAHPLIPCPHEHSEYRDTVQPNCTTDGYSGDAYCTECGEVTVRGTTLKAPGHIYGRWDTNQENHWKTCACGKKAEYGPHKFVWITDREATTSKQGRKHQECSVCGLKLQEVSIDRLSEQTKKNLSKTNITLSQTSYTYDGKAKKPSVTVKDGKTVLKKEKDYSVSYKNNKNAGTAKVAVTGKGNYQGTVTKTFTIKVKKGTSHKVGSYQYKVTGSSAVSVTKLKDGRAAKVKIPKTVKIGGKSFKITAVGNNAFKKNKKIMAVEIGDNVKVIEAGAFEGCVKLSKVTVGKGVTEIGGNTFKDCKKLKNITIKSTKLKKVGRNALKGIKSNAKIKVPAKKLSEYQKLFRKKGQGRKVKIVK